MPAIVFDVDDTLYDLAEPYRRTCIEFFGSECDLPLEEVFIKSRIHSDEAFALVSAGRKPTEYMHVYRVQATFAEYGIDVSYDDALAFQRTYERMQGQIAMSEPIRALLEALVASPWRVGVITNGESAHQWAKLEALGVCDVVPREGIVVSGDIGFPKPHVNAFRAVEECLGVAPHDAWFVGDTYENDVVGSHAAGWSCIWFNRRGRLLTPGEDAADIEVSSEAEMIEAVKGVVFREA